MSSFVHLHLHSQYSLLDGANRLGDVIDAAVQQNMPAVALTDHGNMFGAIDFYNRANRAGIKPIVGIEAYTTQGDHRDRTKTAGGNNHLVLLAKNETGFKNLIKLSSKAYLEGFYYKPRMDRALLREHSEGIIALSACLQGEICQNITQNRIDDAETTANEFREIFGEDNFYLEMQDHGIREQQEANVVIRDISRRTGIPMIVSNDCHYLNQDDSFAHDVLLCIGTQRMVQDEDRLRYASDQFYLKTGEEMFNLFPKDAQAIENTLKIAERCALDIPTGKFHLPDFPIPAGHTLDSYFRDVTKGGLERRLEELRRRNAPMLKEFGEGRYWERLETEMKIVEKMGFPGYFLITWDFVRHARDEGIPVGPGRGSAAGSLVAYALRITDIDPLEYDLLFERFLNPERISMPDIDIDFCMRRRGEVIQYVSEKYGRDHVAQIITFGTLAAKAAIRDVGRVLGLPYGKVDRIAKLVPDMTRSLKEAASEIDALKNEVRNDPEVRQIVDVGTRLEGLTRHASVHAAGVVITPRPTSEIVPLYKTSKDEIVTQWDMSVVESLGLLKMDFLGLRTLTVIDDTLNLLKLQGVELDLDEVPLDDEAVYDLFSDGRTNGIFQFESSGMRDMLRRAKPSKFADLAAFNALYRPGALSVGMVDEFIKRKTGKKKVRYILEETQPILEETYGVIAYQEQVMQIAVVVAGFSLGEADVLRKAMGKKKIEVMNEQKAKFIEGAAGRGLDPNKAAELWEYIEPFAGYGFNKSHSVAYAMLAYKTAYLKAHYPVAFMAAMLTSEMSSKDNVAKYIAGCRDMGISVMPPDINESNWTFTVVGETIRFGLGAVKGIGESAVEAILETRRRVGKFKDFLDFVTEVDLAALNSKVLQCLIKAGCFDSSGAQRSVLFGSYERILAYAIQRQKEIAEGQSTLFGGDQSLAPTLDESVPEWSEREKLSHERETLGLYLTGNPLDQYREEIQRLATHTTEDLKASEGGDGKVRVAGVVSRFKQTKIKSGPNAGRMMGRFELEDPHGALQVAVFADQTKKYGHILKDEVIVLVTGTVRERGTDLEMNVETIESLDEDLAPRVHSLEVTLNSTEMGQMLRLRDLLIENPGTVPVRFLLRRGEKTAVIRLDERYRVAVDADSLLPHSIDQILGPGATRALMTSPGG